MATLNENRNAIKVPPAFDGLDASSAPESIANTKAPILENFLIDRKGKLVMRGPFGATLDSLSAIRQPSGIWTYGDNFLIGRRDPASGLLEPQQTRYLKTADQSDLAKGDPVSNRYVVNGVASTSAGADRNIVPGSQFTRMGNYVYGWAYDTTDVPISEDGGFVTRRRLLKWDGTTGGLSVVANAPDGGLAITSYLTMLWLLGGRDVPSGSPGSIEKNALYFSLGGPTNGTTDDWKDDVSGLVNKIVVDDDDDFLVGSARIQQALVIFKRRATYLLQGTTPSNFSVRRFAPTTGCLDQQSIVEYENGCFFMSDQGFQYFDGVQMISVSNDIDPLLRAAVQNTVGDHAIASGFCRASRQINNYISLQVGSYNSDGTPNVQLSLLFHVPSQGWTILTSNVLIVGDKPQMVGSSYTKQYVFDGKTLLEASYVTNPDGTTTGSETANGQTKRIPARWWSHLVKLAQPLNSSQLHRLLIDYQMIAQGEADDESSGWYVSLWSGRGEELMSEQRVPVAGDSPQNYLYRRQATFDVFSEANDAQIRVEWKDDGTASPALLKAEIYDSAIEFIPSRQRRSG